MIIIDNVYMISELKTEADALKICTLVVSKQVRIVNSSNEFSFISLQVYERCLSVKGDIHYCKNTIGIATQEEVYKSLLLRKSRLMCRKILQL